MNTDKTIQERLNEKMEDKRKSYREHNKKLKEEIKRIKTLSKTKVNEYKAYVGQEYNEAIDKNVDDRIKKYEDMIEENNKRIDTVEERFKDKFKNQIIERDMNRLLS